MNGDQRNNTNSSSGSNQARGPGPSATAEEIDFLWKCMENDIPDDPEWFSKFEATYRKVFEDPGDH